MEGASLLKSSQSRLKAQAKPIGLQAEALLRETKVNSKITTLYRVFIFTKIMMICISAILFYLLIAGAFESMRILKEQESTLNQILPYIENLISLLVGSLKLSNAIAANAPPDALQSLRANITISS